LREIVVIRGKIEELESELKTLIVLQVRNRRWTRQRSATPTIVFQASCKEDANERFSTVAECSQTPNNIAQSYSQRFCNSQQRINSDGSFCPFHLTDVNRMEVRFFSQFFLAESGLFTVQSNVLADQSAMFWAAGHSPLPKQKSTPEIHKLPALDYFLKLCLL
jgi:hypothetical protein